MNIVERYQALPEELQKNPQLLKEFLINCEPGNDLYTLIVMAQKEALTEENIDLAIEKILVEIHQLFGPKVQEPVEIYRRLNSTLHKSPEILKRFLEKYESNPPSFNPILFAGKEALTDENVDLAIKKGNIEVSFNSFLVSSSSPLACCRYFIIECLKRGLDLEYFKISESLKNDSEIKHLIQDRTSKELVTKDESTDSMWSPGGSEQRYHYFAAAIGITFDGAVVEKEIVRNSDIGSHSHFEAVYDIVEDFNKQNGLFSDLLEQLNVVVDNPVGRALLCSKSGIIIIFIEGESSQIFFPDFFTEEQSNILIEMLQNELNNLQFEYFHKGIRNRGLADQWGKRQALINTEIIDYIKSLTVSTEYFGTRKN